MGSRQLQRHIDGLHQQLMELHLQLQQLRATPMSVETRRIFSDVLDQCIRIHQLILTAVRNFTRNPARSEHKPRRPAPSTSEVPLHDV